jgi:hypothetical protein
VSGQLIGLAPSVRLLTVPELQKWTGLHSWAAQRRADLGTLSADAVRLG